MSFDAHNTTSLGTWVGSLSTLVLFGALVVFSTQKLNIVISRTGQTMMQTIKDDFFDESDSFALDQGFAFAFALVNDDFDLAPLTPEIGTIEIYAEVWGYDENSEYFDQKVLLPTHICSEEELGITGNSS